LKKITIETHLEVFESISELPSTIQDLMNKAHITREKGYAPYSHFKVGAALLLKSGKIITGNNQENAVYPSGLCAERVTVFYANATHPDEKIIAMAVTGRSLKNKTNKPVPPCGACRQVLVEYEVKQDAPISVFFMGETGKVIKTESVKELLPLIFDSSYL
jgi:cytidine deaminase